MEEFIWIPSFTLTERANFETLISKGEKGKERRRAKLTTSKPSFQLNFKSVKTETADAIYQFYLDRKGKFEPFFWTHPGTNVQYIVRFDDDSLSRSWFLSNRHKLSIRFQVVDA